MQVIDLKWEEEFQKRFIGFIKKIPIIITQQIKIHDGQKGIQIKHNQSGLQYFFPFDYSVNIKDFIAEIKDLLSNKHYPHLIEDITINEPLTPEEMAIQYQKTKKLQKFKVKTIGQRDYLIDKILLWKGIFILRLVNSTLESDNLNDCWRYKYNGSGMLFLKNYRNNKWGSIEASSNHFFNSSLLIGKIDLKNGSPE